MDQLFIFVKTNAVIVDEIACNDTDIFVETRS